MKNIAFSELVSQNEIKLNWTGPNADGLEFKLLLIQDAQNYWFNEKCKIHSNSLITYNSLTNYEQVISQNTTIKKIECGHSKGCAFWPTWSDNLSDCNMFLSYKLYGLYIKYELSALFDSIVSNSYVQVRFMSGDSLQVLFLLSKNEILY